MNNKLGKVEKEQLNKALCIIHKIAKWYNESRFLCCSCYSNPDDICGYCSRINKIQKGFSTIASLYNIEE